MNMYSKKDNECRGRVHDRKLSNVINIITNIYVVIACFNLILKSVQLFFLGAVTWDRNSGFLFQTSAL